jgi:hypothetical protein
LLHAEGAGLAWQRAKFENDHRRKEAGEGMGIRAGFEQITSQEGGYSALSDSEGKYELILFLLRTLVIEAQTDGYTETGAQCLRVLYGPRPGVAKQAFLIDEYNALQPGPKQRPETQEYQHQRHQFLGKLQEEISNFKTLRDCLRTERGTLFDMERDSLVLGEKAAKIVARDETRLRNYLQQTFKQLITWRQKSGEEGPSGSAASEKPSDHPGSPQGRPGAKARGGHGGPRAAAPPSRPVKKSLDGAHMAASCHVRDLERRIHRKRRDVCATHRPILGGHGGSPLQGDAAAGEPPAQQRLLSGPVGWRTRGRFSPCVRPSASRTKHEARITAPAPLGERVSREAGRVRGLQRHAQSSSRRRAPAGNFFTAAARWVAHTWPLFVMCAISNVPISNVAYIAKCAMYAPPIRDFTSGCDPAAEHALGARASPPAHRNSGPDGRAPSDKTLPS